MTGRRKLHPTTFAVISDLHVGWGARSADLCPYKNDKALEENYVADFITFLKKHSIKADYLLLPGDVTHSGQPEEVQLASEVIKQIATQLSVPNTHVLFVPGNHDADWSVLRSADNSGFRFSQKYAPLQAPGSLFEEILSRGKPHMLDLPHFSTWESSDLFVVGYNSSWKDSKTEPTHHGLAATQDLGELKSYLATLTSSHHRIKLFLVHHHPVLYKDPLPDLPDFNIMMNSGELLNCLRTHKFDFLVHGHKHVPHFQTVIIDSGFPLAILGAGSFSALLDPRWSGLVANQFHTVEVEGREPRTQVLKGNIKTWTYLCGTGWHKSSHRLGISHQVDFGAYMLPEQLTKTLRSKIRGGLSPGGYLKWSTLVKDQPQLRYIPFGLKTNILANLAQEIHFEMHETDEDLIFLMD